MSLINEYSDGNLLDKNNKYKQPKEKKDKLAKKKVKKVAIDGFSEAEFKKSFHEMNNKHSGDGKTFNERQAIKQKLNEEYEGLFKGEQKREMLKKLIHG